MSEAEISKGTPEDSGSSAGMLTKSENDIIHPCKTDVMCCKAHSWKSIVKKEEMEGQLNILFLSKNVSLVSVWVYCLHYPLMHNKYSLQWTFVFCPFQMEHAWPEKKKYIWACSQYKISINVMWLESHLIIGWALFVLSGLIHVWLLPLDYLHVLLQ